MYCKLIHLPTSNIFLLVIVFSNNTCVDITNYPGLLCILFNNFLLKNNLQKVFQFHLNIVYLRYFYINYSFIIFQ